jgi:hypothetical protein
MNVINVEYFNVSYSCFKTVFINLSKRNETNNNFHYAILKSS